MTLNEYINNLIELRNELQTGDISIVKVSDNYELCGNIVEMSKYRKIKPCSMKLVKKQFVDDFDHTCYTSDVYEFCKEDDKDAVKVILL